MGVSRCEDLEIWRIARKLVSEVYEVTSDSRFRRDFSLCDQMRRAALSVMLNIAEGFGRSTAKQFRSFLEIARASCLEIQSVLYVALDLGYISQQEIDAMYETCRKLYAMIGALRRHLAPRT